MKEIGGYFQLDELIKRPYHRNMIELNTGRNALIYLVKAKKITKVYLPFYLCESVYKILNKNFISYDFYNIDRNFHPIFENKLKKNEYLYIANYFGQLTNKKIISLNNKYRKQIIVDNTQAFFQLPAPGVDTIYSSRKYFGVPDGAYLSTDSKIDEVLEIDYSSSRMSHILGRYEGKASDYYDKFRENDKSFIDLPLKKMSNLTHNLLGAIDYEFVIKSRTKNYEFLHENMALKNKLGLIVPYGPYSYPYHIENGIFIRKKLAEKKIYVPTLWPNVLRIKDEKSIEYDYAANILPLPCDQRYTIEDMKEIVKELRKCLN